MTRLMIGGLVCFTVLIFIGLAVMAAENLESPVSSGHQGVSPPRIREGVTGRVTAFDGKPVAGAAIDARSLDNPVRPIPEIAVLTGSDGQYLRPLSPGVYEIAISAEGYRCRPQQATITPGQVVVIDFKLELAP